MCSSDVESLAKATILEDETRALDATSIRVTWEAPGNRSFVIDNYYVV